MSGRSGRGNTSLSVGVDAARPGSDRGRRRLLRRPRAIVASFALVAVVATTLTFLSDRGYILLGADDLGSPRDHLPTFDGADFRVRSRDFGAAATSLSRATTFVNGKSGANVVFASASVASCLVEHDRLAIVGYWDPDHPYSTSLFVVFDTRALTDVAVASCALAATWSGPFEDALTEAPSTKPTIAPCKGRRRSGPFEILWVASTDWMCAVLGGSPLDEPASGGDGESRPNRPSRPDRPSTEPSDPTLRIEMTGPAVRALQERLRELGYGLTPDDVDGDFGYRTKGWVECFQRDHGLAVDGVVGRATHASLKTATADHTTPCAVSGAGASGGAGSNDDGNGGDPPPPVAVPDILGSTAAEAAGALEAAGLRVETIEEPSSDTPPGLVVRAEPSAGTVVPPGTAVTIVVTVVPPDDTPSEVASMT